MLTTLMSLVMFATAEAPTLEHFEKAWSAPEECDHWRNHLSDHWLEDPHLQRCDAPMHGLVTRDGTGYRFLVVDSQRSLPRETSFETCDEALEFVDLALRLNCHDDPRSQTEPSPQGTVGVGGLAGPSFGHLSPPRAGSTRLGLQGELHAFVDLPRTRLELFSQLHSSTIVSTESEQGSLSSGATANFTPLLFGLRGCLSPIAIARRRSGTASVPTVEFPLCGTMAAGMIIAQGLPTDPASTQPPPPSTGVSASAWLGVGGSVGLMWRAHERVQVHARFGGLGSAFAERETEPRLDRSYPAMGPGSMYAVLGLGIPLQSFPLARRASKEER